MDEQQLAELECHIAAGTDLPTALSAVQYDTGQPVRQSKAVQVGLLIGLAIGLLWFLL